MRMLYDPTRRFFIKLSRKKQYDPVEFLLASAILLWNDGTGLDEMSEVFHAFVAAVEKRAVSASRGKMATVRGFNTTKSNLVRDGLRAVSGAGA